MSRILSQHGNVIAADFKPRAEIELPISVETIFCNGAVTVMRCDLAGHIWYMLGDAATGKVISTI